MWRWAPVHCFLVVSSLVFSNDALQKLPIELQGRSDVSRRSRKRVAEALICQFDRCDI